MKIIEKIEIYRFRSIGNETIKAEDIMEITLPQYNKPSEYFFIEEKERFAYRRLYTEEVSKIALDSYRKKLYSPDYCQNSYFCFAFADEIYLHFQSFLRHGRFNNS